MPAGDSGNRSKEEEALHHHSWYAQAAGNSSILTEHNFHVLGQLVRMPDDCLAKQLLLSAPVGGKRALVDRE